MYWVTPKKVSHAEVNNSRIVRGKIFKLGTRSLQSMCDPWYEFDASDLNGFCFTPFSKYVPNLRHDVASRPGHNLKQDDC